QWIGEIGADRICVALDARAEDDVWRLPSEGWTQSEGATLDDLAPRHARAGAQHVLCTDISRDGMLAGPNLGLYAYLGAIAPTLRIIASGGVRDVADVLAL